MLSKLFEKKSGIAKPASNEKAGQGSLLDLIGSSAAPPASGGVQNNSFLSAISHSENEAMRRQQAEIAQQAFRQQAALESPQNQHFGSVGNNARFDAAEQLDFLAGQLDALQQKVTNTPTARISQSAANAAGPVSSRNPNPHAASPSSQGTPPSAEGSLSFDRVMSAVFRAWLPIFICVSIGAALAAAYALSLPNKYESVAEILIEPRGLQVLNDSVAPNGLNREATLAYAESQVRIINSSSVIDPVIEELDLVNDPEFTGLDGGLLDLVFGGGSKKQTTITDAKEYFYSNFYASRVNQTFTILVGISTEDALKSARIANAVARQYISEEAGAKSNIARDANESLNARLADLAAKLEASQRAVEDHRKQFDLIDADGKLVNDVQLARLNEQLALAKVQTGDARTRAEQAKQADLADALSGSLPSAVSSSAINQLRLDYNRAKSRLDRLETRLGNRHPDKIAAKAELRSARDAIAQEIKRTVRAAERDYKRATARQLDLQKQVNTLKAAASSDSPAIVKLRDLESIAAADRRVYETVLLRSRETGEQVEIKSKSARIISEATPADEKLGPNRKLMVLIGAAIGGAIGALLALIPLFISAARATVSGSRSPSEPFPASSGSDDLYASDHVARAPVPEAASVPSPQAVEQATVAAAQADQAQAAQMPLPGFAPQPPVQAAPMMVPQPMVQPVYVQAPPMVVAQPVQPQPLYTAWSPPQAPPPKSEN